MPTTPSSPALLIHVQPGELHAAGPQDAISQMTTLFAQLAGLPDAHSLFDSAMQREASEPTYLGKGMALPHARVEGLSCAGVCVAHSVAGIPWHAEKAQLVIFLAVPEETPELYLQLMSRLVRWRLRLPGGALSAPVLPARDWDEELRALLL